MRYTFVHYVWTVNKSISLNSFSHKLFMLFCLANKYLNNQNHIHILEPIRNILLEAKASFSMKLPASLLKKICWKSSCPIFFIVFLFVFFCFVEHLLRSSEELLLRICLDMWWEVRNQLCLRQQCTRKLKKSENSWLFSQWQKSNKSLLH